MKNKLALSALAILPFMGASAFAAGQTGTINFEYVNIRVNPSINESVKFVLKKGDKVELLSEKDGWYNIKSGNNVGWVSKNAVKLESAQPSNIKTASRNPVKYKYVSNDVLNLRSAASTNSSVLMVLHKNDKLKVLEDNVGWSKVEFGGQVGYVSSKLIKDSIDSNSNSGSNVSSLRTVTTSLNLRNKPSTSGTKITTLNKGDVVELISENKGWAKVRKNGIEGYLSAYYLNNNVATENIISEEVVSESIDINQPSSQDFTKSGALQGGTTYKNMGMTLDAHVNMQISKALNIDSKKGWSKVSSSQLKNYMNPANYTDYNGMMQFVALNSYSDDLTADQLNSYLNKYCKPGNVFYNQGQAFINAAKKNNINVLYLVSHSMIETGYGTSKLASGVSYNGKKVYNFFGIGAVDGNAVGGGSATAYKNGWTSVAAGIDGAASWIATKYIHNTKFNQNTLYEMKWCSSFIWHQYASDVSWPSMIGKKMAELGKYSTNLSELRYVVPQYN